MEYREIVSVTGIGGLFQLIATKSDGAIVRNLADKSTKFIPARLHNVTPLESIEIYTTGDNLRLHEVLQRITDSEATPMPDTKTAGNNEIKAYFQTILPELDEDRVYVSDMKKMLKWYGILKANELLNFEALKKEETTEESPAENVVETSETVPAAKKSADEEAAAEVAEKPKKTARKKKAVPETPEAEEKPAKKTAKKKKED